MFFSPILQFSFPRSFVLFTLPLSLCRLYSLNKITETRFKVDFGIYTLPQLRRRYSAGYNIIQ